MTKPCAVCGIDFAKPNVTSVRAWNTLRKHCSRACSAKARTGRIVSDSARAKLRISSLGRKHTAESIANMSGAKAHAWKGGLPHCADCGERVAKYKATRCGKCRIKRSVGKDSPHWQGGITPLNLAIRNSPKYAEWRNRIFQRDGRKCVWCGSAEPLNADHIYPFSAILRGENIKSVEDAMKCQNLWLIDNGRTLCEPCHETTDTFKGKAKRVFSQTKQPQLN